MAPLPWRNGASDGKFILTSSYDKTAKLWETETGREVLTLRGHSDLVECAALSPDGRFALTGSGEDEAARLAQGLFDYAAGTDSAVKVLLLSATPYRMYTLADEPEDEDDGSRNPQELHRKAHAEENGGEQ